MLADTRSINDRLSRFWVVSDKVSLLERANVSDARPLARLTSDNHSATTAVFYLFVSLFFFTCCVR